MKYFDWDQEKNNRLKAERDVSFEDVVIAIAEGKLLDIIDNPNQKKYPSQKVYIVNIEEYVYIVPFVEDKVKYFLKTVFPSRKMTKKYLISKAFRRIKRK